jgi:hypothetical protein
VWPAAITIAATVLGAEVRDWRGWMGIEPTQDASARGIGGKGSDSSHPFPSRRLERGYGKVSGVPFT